MGERPTREDRTIVVCVTDSPESLHAVGVAAQLVSEKGELVFLHVLEVPLELSLDAPPLPEEAPAQRGARELLGRCRAIAERYGVSNRGVIERRHAPGPAIVEVADRRRASLLVMAGDERFSRAGRLKLGATATYVLRHARCRVMVISDRPSGAHAVAKVA